MKKKTTKDIKLGSLIDGELTCLDTTPPKPTKDFTAFAMEAVVDPTPQALRKIRPFTDAILKIPPGLKGEAEIVLQHLLSCFEKQKEVKEGKLLDLMWGFEQCGIPRQLTANGIVALQRAGYVELKAPDNAVIDFSAQRIEEAWVCYKPKLLELVYEALAT